MPSSDPTEPLVVRRLTDPDQLARLLQREPVNPVDDVEEPDVFERALADRTDVDRRVFGLVPRCESDRTRTVLWVALTRGPASSLVELTDDRAPTAPADADTAVFWSIWNDDPELAGAGSGLDLILGAAQLLADELPHLHTFTTLSPVPGLRRWVESDADSTHTDSAHTDSAHTDSAHTDSAHTDDPTALAATAARDLTSLDDRGTPIDPVARFHLRNGARLWRLLPGGDPSSRGAARSFGLLASYRYAPEDRDANRTSLDDGTVAVGESVAALLD